MSQHLTNAQIQTILAKTVSNLKPYEFYALEDALKRVVYVRAADFADGTGENTLGQIFPSGGPNP